MNFSQILLYISLLFFAVTSCKSIQPEQPDTVLGKLPIIHQPTSVMTFPVYVNLEPFFESIELEVPKVMEGEEQACEGLSYAYYLKRDKIKYVGIKDKLHYNVLANYSLKINYCPECTYLFSSNGNCVIPRVYASCGIGEPMRQMEVGYSSSFSVTPNWQLKSETKLRKVDPIDPCQVTFLNYNATDELVKEITILLTDLEKDIDQSISSVDLKSSIKDTWDGLSTPINLGNYGFFAINPQTIAMDEISFVGKKAKINLSLSIAPKLSLDSIHASNKPLPQLSKHKQENGFDLILDAEANYDSLNVLFKKELVGQEMLISGKKVIFEDIKVFSTQEQKLNIEVQISGSKKGTLYFTGTPVFHSLTQEISMPDLAFDVKTKNALLKSAKWLFNDRIEKLLRESTKINLTEKLHEMKQTLEKEMNIDITEGVQLMSDIQHLQIADIYPFTDKLYLRILLKGKLEVHL